MDYDEEEDFVFVGTPIEREEDASSRKKKSLAESSGQLRSLPAWKQEVRDEEGRRRFHGAFTGGFSAGYYNTAGSKEGWAPQSFTSSRKNRAEFKQQNIYSFLDEDEKAELQDHSFRTSSQFDTFGFTAAELAQKQAEKEQQSRPSAIPGPIPEEILPVRESVGVKLLTKMGWRHGRSIKDSHTELRREARREARKAFLAFSSENAKAEFGESEPDQTDHECSVKEIASDGFGTSRSMPVYVVNPKEDVHGLGYDPYRNAPEFREKKKSRLSGTRDHDHRNSIGAKDNLFGFKSGKVAPGFGIGALEELGLEDEDIYASGYEIADIYTEELDDEPQRPSKESKQNLITYEKDGLPGFKVASNLDCTSERYIPPAIPKDYVPRHKFPGPLEIHQNFADPQPPEVPPPEDSNLKLLIDGVATLVARCGRLFEDLSREKNQSNPLFGFLSGGDGHSYYLRKLWEERQKRNDESNKHLDGKMSPSMRQMTAESRAKILGEKPLERSSKSSCHSVPSNDLSHVQSNLSHTPTLQISLSELLEAKPFKDDPAKQGRYEQFLKEKYQGGLRSTGSSGANNLSEAARARERLDFESVIEALQKGKSMGSDFSAQKFVEFSLAGKMQFTSGGIEDQVRDNQAEELMMKKMYPKREEFQWRPSPLLCKRFDLIDPYMGKLPPAPRLRSKMESKMDSMVFMPESVKTNKVDSIAVKEAATVSHSEAEEWGKDVSNAETEIEEAVENVERPVDLYKAIFSDDSDNDEDEKETSNLNKVEDSEKKNEAANTALSRLIAGDFLESLGKELGLEVPPDTPHITNNAKVPATQKAYTNGSSMEQDMQNKPETAQDVGHVKTDVQNRKEKDRRRYTDNSLSENGSDDRKKEKRVKEDKKSKASSSRHRDWSSSSSDDEKSRKRSKRRRYRSSDSYSDSSSDNQGGHHSSSKSKKGSSKEKHGSSGHSKHKHRRKDSPSKSHRYSEKTYREARKERRKRRD